MPSKYRIVHKYTYFNEGLKPTQFNFRYVLEKFCLTSPGPNTATTSTDYGVPSGEWVDWSPGYATLEEAKKYMEDEVERQKNFSKPPVIIQEYEF